jgi:16S rRNA (cytidine1402-2'-O)-methyltransferase
MGTLYLLPVPLAPDAIFTLPSEAMRLMAELDYFLVENLAPARQWISICRKQLGVRKPHAELVSIKQGQDRSSALAILAQLKNGHSVGLISDAGCPVIADPGAWIVAWAHEHQFTVRPVVGPSSLLLAIMASGFGSQLFTFQGYLPVKTEELRQKLHALQRDSQRTAQAHYWIETPYRSMQMLEALGQYLDSGTWVSLAVNLTSPVQERTFRCRAGQIRLIDKRLFDRQPVVFGLWVEAV